VIFPLQALKIQLQSADKFRRFPIAAAARQPVDLIEIMSD
jgi:hypothetical protein